jgi:glycosyltransferase involved in cell wall biosynthesis
MKRNPMKKICFWCPYPFNDAPGQRFRYEQYADLLREAGFDIVFLSFLDTETKKVLYQKGNYLKKITGVLKGYGRRFGHLISSRNADFVFIYREAAPLGFPFFEWFLTKMMKKKIIYDFDDAVWIPVVSKQNKLIFFLKNASKVAEICRFAYRISAGNQYLCDNAARFRGNYAGVFLNPTTIDTEKMHNRMKNQREGTLTVGWTGTHSTLCYLDEIVDIIKSLSEKYDFEFLVICNQNPNYDVKNFKFVEWREESEIEDLLALHIGLMPLSEDAWAAGKCGFKALQYMALGIPAVVSPVGVNRKIVEEGKTGFLCQNASEWESALEKLLQNADLREETGKKARDFVSENYSVKSNSKNFLNLFA